MPSVINRGSTATRASLVETDDGFAQLHEPWNRLAAQTDPGCVFLRHEWFEAAWQWARHDAELAVVVVESKGAVLGICPLVRRTRKRNGISLRVLEFLTVPDAQHCALLANARDLDVVLQSVAYKLAADMPGWDLLELGNLSERHQSAAALSAALNQSGLSADHQRAGINPTVDLTQPWEGYYRGRSRHLKKNNNLVANRMRRAGAIGTVWVNGHIDPDNLDGHVDTLVRLSAASWKNQTGLTLNHPGPEQFIRHLSRLAAAQGWLSIWFLTLDGTPVAMEYQLLYNGHVHALRSDFDEAQRELSPGSHLNWKMLERLFASDLRKYYMGPGENAYKMRWTECGEALYRVTAYNKTVAGYAMQAMDKAVRPLVRKLKEATAGGNPTHEGS